MITTFIIVEIRADQSRFSVAFSGGKGEQGLVPVII